MIEIRCSVCKQTDVIKVYEPEQVKFKCKNGHIWFEDYDHNGGLHIKPDFNKIQIEDMLFAEEKVIYSKILNELDKNKEFYTKASPEEKTKTLMANTKLNEKDVYLLLKKIAAYKVMNE
ncbi:MAG: hypothetical protein CVU88_06945 [Firmicutes bacterium HGW-Firmicutes-13]|nr:MAG: hypothetical protein CVU88_06945 [Firmicutes bacterium HGW-Firmicutes-13]